MRITVIGGTGLIGAKLCERLRELGHEAIAVSPSTGFSTITGEGLDEALKGAQVAVDVSDSPSLETNAAMEFFRTSAQHLLKAAAAAGVEHIVVLSVVGVDRLPEIGYFRAKLEQEKLIGESGIPYSILRATQFFEFAPNIVQAGLSSGEVHIPDTPVQPVASDEVVEALADMATGVTLNAVIEIAGAERMPLYEFIRYYLNAVEDPHPLIEDKHALFFGARLNDEALVPGGQPLIGKTRYEEWFRAQYYQS